MDCIDTTTGQPIDGAPLGQLLTAQAAATPDAPALTFGDRTLSYRQIDRRANQRARQLAALGVKTGDPVILALGNRPEYFDCVYALWKLGAVPCPVSNRLTPDEFDAIVQLADPRLVLCDDPPVTLSAPMLKIDGPPPADEDDSPLPPAVSTPGKIACSGGSTGRPKLIVDPLPSVWGPDKEVFGRPPRSTLLNVCPLYHSGPFNISHMALAQGCHVVCMERFDGSEWLRLIERHRVAFAYVVPTIMTRISKLDPAITGSADLSSLRTLVHTAAPCPPATKTWWIDRIGGRQVMEIYGGSERIGATLIDGEEWLARPGSVGRAFPGQQIVILGDDGQPLGPGEIGEIRFRPAPDAPERYAYIGSDARKDGGLDGFGDMGWVDEEGYLFIADRRTDMIVVGGVNIYPAEIEAVLDSLPGVLASAVIGLPDEDLGNRVHAIVEIDGQPPEQARFLAELRSRLAGLKVPRTVEFTTRRIRDDAGKVRRSQLRQDRLGGS